MYKVEVIFKNDKTKRKFPFEETFMDYKKAVQAVCNTDKEDIDKAFVRHYRKDNDYILVWDNAVLTEVKERLGICK